MRIVLVALAAMLGLGCGVARSPEVAPASSAEVVSGPAESGIDVVWIGHATALIRIDDKWILTDPNFSDRVGWVYERYVAPGLSVEQLPPIDAVLISHAHLDHLDDASLEALVARSKVAPASLIVAPPDAMDYVPGQLDLGERVRLKRWKSVERDGLRITAVPARHGKGRYYIDMLWQRHGQAGFIIEYGPHTVYFAGDTGYRSADARELRKRFDIDLALIPVGPADRPGWVHHLRKSVHAGPKEAMQLFADSGAQWMVPIHFGTFFKRSTGERRAIVQAIDAHPLFDRVKLLEVGGAAKFRY